MIKNYPEYYNTLQNYVEMMGTALPGPMSGFTQLHEQALTDCGLSAKTKELIALGIAICLRCDGGIAYHVHDAMIAGASHEEITEAIGVAVLMGGEPSVVYVAEAFEALSQFEDVSVVEEPVMFEYVPETAVV